MKEDTTSDESDPDDLQDQFSDDHFEIDDHIKAEMDHETAADESIHVKTEETDPLHISMNNNDNGLATTAHTEDHKVVNSKDKVQSKLIAKPDRSSSRAVKSPVKSVKSALKAVKVSTKKATKVSPTIVKSKLVRSSAPPKRSSARFNKPDVSPSKSASVDTVANNVAKLSAIASSADDTEKAYLCPVDGCDEIRLWSDLQNGADVEHMINSHGLEQDQVDRFELSWPLVAICRFKSRVPASC